MKNFLVLCFVFCLGLSASLQAQEPVYRQYNTLNGLSSSETYDVIECENGFIWIATNYGLVRFDGFNFTLFDKQSGMPQNTIFKLAKDNKGNIWFTTFNGLLGYCDGEKIYSYSFNPNIEAFFHNMGLSAAIFSDYSVEDDGTIQFDFMGKGRFQIDQNGNITSLKKGTDKPFFDLILKKQGKVSFNSSTSLGQQTIRIIDSQDTNHFVLKFSIVSERKALIYKAIHRNGTLYFSNGRELLMIRNDVLVRSAVLENGIISLHCDNEGKVWVGTLNDGVFVFDENLNPTYPGPYLRGNSISSIFTDHEGGMWLTSLNNGVFYLPTTAILKLDRSNGLPSDRIEVMEIDPFGNLWLAANGGYLSKLDPRGNVESIEIGSPQESVISDLKWDSNRNCLFISTNAAIYYQKGEKLAPKPFIIRNIDGTPKSNSGSIKCINKNPISGEVYFGKYVGFMAIDTLDRVTEMSSDQSKFTERVEALEIDNKGVCWMGTLYGLWQYAHGEYIHFGHVLPLLNERITEIKAINDTLLLGTRGLGLLVLCPSGLFDLTMSDGLLSHSVTCIEADDKHIYVGSNKGISVINRRKLLNAPNIDQINLSTGLISNEITSIKLSGKLLYIGTTSGLNIIDNQKLTYPENHFPIMITHLAVNGKSTPLKSDLKIKFNQNSIEIDYFAISFRNKGKISYRHHLVGLNSEWIENQRTSAQYPYLPPGDYTFEVMSKNLRGEWNPMPASFSFTVLKPYWAEWWFVALMVVLAFSLIILSIMFFLKFHRRRNQLLQDTYRYQQEALIGQMNPHFMFNALNTVQRYIIENDKVASSKFLSKFAQLMRKTLENSQENEISVRQEIEVLRLYLEVESVRHSHKFTFDLHCTEGFDPDSTLIPVFIIQPLVENAVRHGLMNADYPGQLQVVFFLENDMIICHITDNGVGRQESARLNKGNEKKSLGTSIIRKRIALRNHGAKQKMSLTYKDLKNADGTAAGTEVVVSFPYLLIQPQNEEKQSSHY